MVRAGILVLLLALLATAGWNHVLIGKTVKCYGFDGAVPPEWTSGARPRSDLAAPPSSGLIYLRGFGFAVGLPEKRVMGPGPIGIDSVSARLPMGASVVIERPRRLDALFTPPAGTKVPDGIRGLAPTTNMRSGEQALDLLYRDDCGFSLFAIPTATLWAMNRLALRTLHEPRLLGRSLARLHREGGDVYAMEIRSDSANTTTDLLLFGQPDSVVRVTLNLPVATNDRTEYLDLIATTFCVGAGDPRAGSPETGRLFSLADRLVTSGERGAYADYKASVEKLARTTKDPLFRRQLESDLAAADKAFGARTRAPEKSP